MPPLPHWYRGLDGGHRLRRAGPADRVRLLAAPADQRERPARRGLLPAATTTPARTCAWSINVLTLRGERIAEITSFIGPEHFALLGLPASLP